MKHLALLLPVALLAACNSEPAPAPAATETAVATPTAAASLPAPDQETFSTLFHKACPTVEKVNQAVCKRAGFGSEKVTCDYSLGEDKYMRHNATLAPQDGAWALEGAEAVCKQHTDEKQG